MKSILRYSSFLLLALVAIAVAVATVVEDAQGSNFAYQHIYGSLWFKLLWGALTIFALRHIYSRKLWQRPALMLLHLSFVVILTGALVTSLTSYKGTLHLRKGIPSPLITSYNGEGLAPLSLRRTRGTLVRLDDFYISYYPGTEAPQDYVSHITIEHKPYTISMNHIATHNGWRFYQSSYDPDLQGSILTITYDPWGTPVTYVGYFLLALGVVLIFYQERQRAPNSIPLDKQQRHKSLYVGMGMCALVLCTMTSLFVIEKEKDGGPIILWNNRPTPFCVMSEEFMLKVHGKDSYEGLPATKVIMNIMKEPHRWSKEEIIKVGFRKYRSLESYVDSIDGSLKGLGKSPKEDEKVALMLMLMQGSLIKPLPADMTPPSPLHVKAEILYHSHDWLLWCIILLGIGLLCRKLKASSLYTLHLALYTLIALWLIRWFISGHIPLSNGYETLIFVAASMLMAAIAKPRLTMPAMGASLLLLVVARMGAMNPQITPLMPVLHSPWLSAHVSIIMISYALLVLSMVERSLLRPAVCLLAVGIFLGAVWANVSWGTYWSWDPKESWALITLLVYCIPLHQQSLPWFRSQRNYRIYSLLALACLLMTYFGVNFLLGGMHSYGAA